MLILIGYVFIILILILFLLLIIIYVFFLIFSSFMGSPYVPTRNEEIDVILKVARLKKGKIFIELGCGDGRVVRTAVAKYGVIGIGIDINPTVLLQARFWSQMQKLKNIVFKRQNIFTVDLKNANYLYLFLFPPIIKKLKAKMEKELKKGTIVISHGFKIEGWEEKLIKTIPHSPFPTYFYLFDKRS